MKAYLKEIERVGIQQMNKDGHFIPSDYIVLVGTFDYYTLKSHITDEHLLFRSEVFQNEIIKIKIQSVKMDDAFEIISKKVLETISGTIFDEILDIVTKDNQ
jgi:hypothetical protein